MRYAFPVLALIAQPGLASSAPRILDCTFTTECNSAEGQCTAAEAPILSFTLIVAMEGGSARYEGDTASPPMAVSYTEDGVLLLYDPSGPTLTSVGADGTAVHSSNLILLGHLNRAAQWAGTCSTR